MELHEPLSRNRREKRFFERGGGKTKACQHRSRKDKNRASYSKSKVVCYFCGTQVGVATVPQNLLQREIFVCSFCMESEREFLIRYNCLELGDSLENDALVLKAKADLAQIFFEYKQCLDSFYKAGGD